ncbi:head-tail connector protein [Lysinibacillus sp. UGB7]|uniref:head-tail connector protein n=1 Tax=Lysinibacillus sp. UGB7 TaxID=3411039 RepID=UPI003B7E7114
MPTLLEELKEYLRIDGDDENQSLSMFIQSAQSYLENAGVKQPNDYYLTVKDKDVFVLHRLSVLMLSTHFYENRIAITPSTIKTAQQTIPYGLKSIILQLKWVDPDELSVQQ